MDKFALFRFPEESPSVGSVNMIKGYDPIVKHSSKSWPVYSGPSQKGNWVKVSWPDEDKRGRATGTSTLLAAQVVKFSPVRSELERLLKEMLNETATEAQSTSNAKKHGKRKDTLEDRILRRLRDELDRKDQPGTSTETVDGSAEPGCYDGEAESKLKLAEAKAAAAMERCKAAEEEMMLLRERAEAAEARAEAAETKALFAVDTLYPLLQELPSLVDALRGGGMAASASNAAESGLSGHSFKFGSITIPAVRMVRLENLQPSIYTQELAGMVFGCDVLANSCLKGSGTDKQVLEKEAVDDIVVHVMTKYGGITESAVRSFLRRKCNNAASALKKGREF